MHDTADRGEGERSTASTHTVWRNYATEFIGSFFLVLAVGCSVLSKSALAPLGIGVTLTVMVYAGGHISGGHFNPSVSLGVAVRGKMGLYRTLGYALAQIAGGVLAAVVAQFIVDPGSHPALSPTGRDVGAVFLAELLFTFALVYVVLNVATSADHPHNGFYGLAIGLTVVAGITAVGAISGGFFNPAVTLGGAVMGLVAWSKIWIWLVAQLVAAGLAGVAFILQNPQDTGDTTFTRRL
ncbi:MIP/aquaporin family protein [Streptomyces sp. NPDC048512]|uniref:MIP/aquaporin family protein n=1 Tax=Streptomyces sp. NPDC048512 TaxID=3365563 RepID=UPI00371AC56E